MLTSCYITRISALLGIGEEDKRERMEEGRERTWKKEEKVIGQLMVCSNQRSMKREVAVLEESVNRENEQTKKI